MNREEQIWILMRRAELLRAELQSIEAATMALIQERQSELNAEAKAFMAGDRAQMGDAAS